MRSYLPLFVVDFVVLSYKMRSYLPLFVVDFVVSSYKMRQHLSSNGVSKAASKLV